MIAVTVAQVSQRCGRSSGLTTSVALLLPLGTYAYWLAWSQSLADRVTVAASLAWAIGAHVVLLAGVVAIYVAASALS